MTQSTDAGGLIFSGEKLKGRRLAEQHLVEDAVMASEIEALPDRAGFVKFASAAAWNWVEFPYYVVPEGSSKPFEGA